MMRPVMVQEALTIETDSETLARLDTLAEALNSSRDRLAERALKAFIEEQMRQIEAIREGLASLDAGEIISHEDLMAELRARLEEARASGAE